MACRTTHSRQSSRHGRSAGFRRSGATGLSISRLIRSSTPSPLIRHLVWFSSEGEKDSASFARETREFVANLVGRDLAVKMNRSAVERPARRERIWLCRADTGSLNAGGKPPRVAEAPAALECKVTQIFEPQGPERRTCRRLCRHRRGGRRAYRRSLSDRWAVRHSQGGQRLAAGLYGLRDIDATFAMRRPRWGKD